VSLAQVQYFVTVSALGHVGRAAEALHVAQPAISRQIKNLEDELGARLFVRTPRGMRLSPEGEVFLVHARAILEQVSDAREAVTALRRSRSSPSRQQS
jgi:DNA-binding transcriptional LysR family regulator